MLSSSGFCNLPITLAPKNMGVPYKFHIQLHGVSIFPMEASIQQSESVTTAIMWNKIYPENSKVHKFW